MLENVMEVIGDRLGTAPGPSGTAPYEVDITRSVLDGEARETVILDDFESLTGVVADVLSGSRDASMLQVRRRTEVGSPPK